METLNNQKTERTPKIKLNLDEFDLDNYELNPLTQGLGFHCVKKEKAIAQPVASRVEKTLNKTSVSEHQNSLYPQVSLKKLSGTNYTGPLKSSMSDSIFQQETCSSFSSDRKFKETGKLKKDKLKNAREVDQLCAFFIDSIIIVGTYLGIMWIFISIAGLPFEWKALKGFGPKFWPYIGLLSVSIFLFYFTLLDSAGTVGKRFMGLQLIDSKNSKTTNLKQSFFRALISLLCLVLLGFPFLVNFQDKISHTKLVEV